MCHKGVKRCSLGLCNFDASRSFTLTFYAMEAVWLRQVKIIKTSNLSNIVPGEIDVLESTRVTDSLQYYSIENAVSFDCL